MTWAVSTETWKNGLTRRRNYLAEEGNDLLVRLWSHRRHFPNERDEIPDRCIIQGLAPRGHRAHFDAMFDRPECFSGITGIFLR